MYFFSELKIRHNSKIKLVPIDMIISNKYKFRTYNKGEEIKTLTQNIKDYGILQPLLTKKIENDMHEIIFGHRRFLAAKEAKLSKIPVVVTNLPDEKLKILSTSENFCRENLNFFEEANVIFELIDKCGFSQDMISSVLGVTQIFITDRLNILKLSKKVKEYILKNNLALEYALLLSEINDVEEQLQILNVIIQNNLDIFESEKIIKNYKQGKCIINDFSSFSRNTVYVIKDIRLFENTISKAIDVMNQSGVKASSIKNDCEDFVEYIIQIPKDKIFVRKSVGF